MVRFAEIAVLAWIVCAAAHAAGAGEPEHDASAMFDAASAAFARGDFATAAAEFAAAHGAGMDGPAVLYNLGVSYYKLGDYEEAEAAFRSLAAEYPDMRELAQYNLGLTLHRQDRVDEARAAFELARGSEDEAIARLAAAMLERSAPPEEHASPGDAAPPPPSWVKLVDVALGHDDNVALVDEASLPVGRSTDSPFAEAFGLISRRVGAESALRLDASAYAVRYGDADEFDQDAVRLGFAYLWRWNTWRLDVGPYYNYSSLSGEGFEQRLGAALSARYPFNDSASLLVRFAHDEVDDVAPEFEFVAGSRDRVSLGFEQRRDRGRLEIGYVHERNDRLGAGVSPTRHEVFAGYERSLTTDWSIELQGMLRTSRYDELLVPRDEDLSQLSLTAIRDFDSGWQLLGQYRIADNASNVEEFSYDRNRFVVGLNKLF